MLLAKKTVGFILIIIGIAGLILPVVPGVLLIAIGTLLFFKNVSPRS